MTCDELTKTPIPSSPVLLLVGEKVNIGSKVKSRKQEGVSGKCSEISFYFSLSDSDLTGSKLNIYPSGICFAHGSNW